MFKTVSQGATNQSSPEILFLNSIEAVASSQLIRSDICNLSLDSWTAGC